MEREDEMGVIPFFYYFGEENADEHLDAPFYNGSRGMCSGCVAFECTRSCVSTGGSFRARHVVSAKESCQVGTCRYLQRNQDISAVGPQMYYL